MGVAVLALVIGAPALGKVDTSIPGPCEDFDPYINGAWLAATVLPADRARVGSFDALQDRNRAVMLAALRDASANAALLDASGKQKTHAFL
jgi:putative endopeptidase